jgi:hypothetical protein
MKMPSVVLGVGSYADFKTVFNSLKDRKGNIYYFNDPSSNFSVAFVPFSGEQVVYLTAGNSVNSAGSGAGIPSTFSTDFPAAILISSSRLNINFSDVALDS